MADGAADCLDYRSRRVVRCGGRERSHFAAVDGAVVDRAWLLEPAVAFEGLYGHGPWRTAGCAESLRRGVSG